MKKVWRVLGIGLGVCAVVGIIIFAIYGITDFKEEDGLHWIALANTLWLSSSINIF